MSDEGVSPAEGAPSPLLELIALRSEALALLARALADPEQGGRSETPGDQLAERELTQDEVLECARQGDRARGACNEASAYPHTCYVIGVLAEADCLEAKQKEPEKKSNDAGSPDEGAPSPLLELIALRSKELVFLANALADPDRDGRSETPGDEVAERQLTQDDVSECAREGGRAGKACQEAGGYAYKCHAADRIAEAKCLRAKLKEPEKQE